MHALLLFAFFQAPGAAALSATTPVALYSGCSTDAAQIGTVGANDSVEVEMARAGDGPMTCYKIAIARQGQTLTGYVLGDSLPAVAAFAKRRREASQQATEAQARMALAAAKAEKTLAKPLPPDAPSHIDDFAWRDWQGKAGSLSGLGGRVTLVTFWPPSRKSRAELNAVIPLYDELHNKGLAAVGIAMAQSPKSMYEVLDDTVYKWPQIPDRDGLAARYHIDARSGETLVLDASHNVVAAGQMGPAIEKAVRDLLAAP